MATNRSDSEDKGNINCKQLKLITLIALGRTRVRREIGVIIREGSWIQSMLEIPNIICIIVFKGL